MTRTPVRGGRAMLQRLDGSSQLSAEARVFRRLSTVSGRQVDDRFTRRVRGAPFSVAADLEAAKTHFEEVRRKFEEEGTKQ